jgi:ribonucleoside-diphosphate reductase alpha chain
MSNYFRTSFAKNIFDQKYGNGLTWKENSCVLVEEVCDGLLREEEKNLLKKYITEMKFIPAGRYLYYAGKKANFYNNCFCLGAEEDTREEWARLTHSAMLCLMCGGGIGIDYSKFRGYGEPLGRTGGIASGPIPLMQIMNEVGRNVIQGGSRRSAMYASLQWNHKDIDKFLTIKNWSDKVKEIKANDFNFPAPLDMTNISVNYDDDFLKLISLPTEKGEDARALWMNHIRQALKTAEPGFSFNFGLQSKETLRNA